MLLIVFYRLRAVVKPQFLLFRSCKLSFNDLFSKLKYKVPYFWKFEASKKNEWSLIFEFQTENIEYNRGEFNSSNESTLLLQSLHTITHPVILNYFRIIINLVFTKGARWYCLEKVFIKRFRLKRLLVKGMDPLAWLLPGPCSILRS